ncbi:MAG: hypothetical protein ACLQI7_00085 [Streptosporangiaceae bacterium]|jgi:hypothetical protein
MIASQSTARTPGQAQSGMFITRPQPRPWLFTTIPAARLDYGRE